MKRDEWLFGVLKQRVFVDLTRLPNRTTVSDVTGAYGYDKCRHLGKNGLLYPQEAGYE